MSHFRVEHSLDVPADAVLKVFTQTDTLARYVSSLGARDVSCTCEGTDAQQICLQISYREAFRSTSGRKLRGRTVQSCVRMSWQLDRMRCSWERTRGALAHLVLIAGSLQIEPLGTARCILVERGLVSVRIPLLGRLLERRIVQIIRDHRPKRTAALERLTLPFRP